MPREMLGDHPYVYNRLQLTIGNLIKLLKRQTNVYSSIGHSEMDSRLVDAEIKTLIFEYSSDGFPDNAFSLVEQSPGKPYNIIRMPTSQQAVAFANALFDELPEGTTPLQEFYQQIQQLYDEKFVRGVNQGEPKEFYREVEQIYRNRYELAAKIWELDTFTHTPLDTPNAEPAEVILRPVSGLALAHFHYTSVEESIGDTAKIIHDPQHFIDVLSGTKSLNEGGPLRKPIITIPVPNAGDPNEGDPVEDLLDSERHLDSSHVHFMPIDLSSLRFICDFPPPPMVDDKVIPCANCSGTVHFNPHNRVYEISVRTIMTVCYRK